MESLTEAFEHLIMRTPEELAKEIFAVVKALCENPTTCKHTVYIEGVVMEHLLAAIDECVIADSTRDYLTVGKYFYQTFEGSWEIQVEVMEDQAIITSFL
ncbi:hypothetical protein L596_021220 [Steinernema carpocapsae]|uniref:Uncharacterized protein n=1 Tax=Steinernema carpocapsae TaxID=34508 RepID=A0A4V6A148_STECR|nr:hypothetical protein L596_021220 [Steinernema carpocapsae]